MTNASTKPYLLRAIYDWCKDNGHTPYIKVRADEHTRLPQSQLKEGEILLNIGPLATPDLLIDNEALSCSLRFAGQKHSIYVHLPAVVAIFARENGQGIFFDAPVNVTQETHGVEAFVRTPQKPTKPANRTGNAEKSAPASKVTLRIVE